MARNTQLVLQEESNLGRVIDPAGGSWYVETLTEQIAEASWALFGELEAAGGLPGVLLDGSLAARISAVRRERLERVATREEPVTGVSEFADVGEVPEVRTGADLRTLRDAPSALHRLLPRGPVRPSPPSATRYPRCDGPRSSRRCVTLPTPTWAPSARDRR